MPQTTQTVPTPQAAQPPKPKPPEPPPEFQENDIATMDATALIRILTDASSTEFQKAKACQRTGELDKAGDAAAVNATDAGGSPDEAAVARRGWLGPSQVLNSLPYRALLQRLQDWGVSNVT